MSQEDKPCSQHPNAPHGFDRNASHNAGRYVCECEGWQPVAAQEPSEQLANKLGMVPVDAWRFNGIEASIVIAALYANAAQCARCKELETVAWLDSFATARNNGPSFPVDGWSALVRRSDAEAKITEQAAVISGYKADQQEQLQIQVEQAAEIKALEAEVERQRKVIKLCKEAMTWDVGGEPLPTLEVEALAAIAELEKGVG